jgi:nucleoside-diphosphate-sugar epimerase
MNNDRKITVIGGSGFVGTNFCQLLEDHQIPFEIVDLKPSERFPEKWRTGDVRDLDSLRANVTGDVVINLAAVHRDDVRDKMEYARTNILGAENTARICTEKGIRKIVFTSTVAVYGFAEPGTGESGRINPFNEYGWTKFAAEEKLRAWSDADAANKLFIVRPTVIFGEGNRGNVHNLFNQIASGRFVMIGNGRNRKSMAYVGNVVAFLKACVDSDRHYALFNYVDTPDMDMNTLVSYVRRTLSNKHGVGPRLPYWLGLFLGYAADWVAWLTGRTLPVSSIRARKFCSSTAFTSAKQELDGFEPPYKLLEGIERTLQSEFINPNPSREIFFTE